MTRTLGAILAGGLATRFGSDKALALLDGTALIERVADRLRPQVDGLIVVGRTHSGIDAVSDRPHAGLGPLGGFAGALHHAAASGFDRVLTVPCDAPGLPHDLLAILGSAPAGYFGDLPVIGCWPVTAAATLDRLLASGGSRSVRAFADAIGAVACGSPQPIANVNTPDDLARLASTPADRPL